MNRFRDYPSARRVGYLDIEADGLAELNRPSSTKPLEAEVSRIWCVVIIDQDGEVFRYGPDEIAQAGRDAMGYDVLIGHNLIEYDWRVLKRFGHVPPAGGPVLVDTLTTARMFWPDRKLCPHVDRHSLDAWGQFLAERGDIEAGKTKYRGGFGAYSEEMMDYCEQDVLVTKALWAFLWSEADDYHEPLEREHRRAERLAAMTEAGVAFDLAAAKALLVTIQDRKAAALAKLREAFPPRLKTYATPAYYLAGGRRFDRVGDAKVAGYRRADIEAGPLRSEEIPFEPTRDQLVANFVAKYGWRPTQRTKPSTTHPQGKPQMNEEVLDALTYPEASIASEYWMCGSRISELNDYVERTEQSRDGRIHPMFRPTGTVTGRCSSKQPNGQNVTSPRKTYGEAIRRLFMAPPGRMLVSADADQMEVRVIASALARFDDGRYSRKVAGSDAHQVNADLMGVDRPTGKLGGLSLMYDIKPASFARKMDKTYDEGLKIFNDFHKSLPELRYFQEWCNTQAVTRGHMRLIDGRDAPVRQYDDGDPQAPVNTLIQGNGQCLMTLAWELIDAKIRSRGLDAFFVLEVHDEAMLDASEADAAEVAAVMEASITEAGEILGFQCPMTGSAAIGRNWFEVH